MIKLIPLNCMANTFLPLPTVYDYLIVHPVSHDYAINYVITHLFNLNFGHVQACKCRNYHSCNHQLANSYKTRYLTNKKGSADTART